MNKDLNYIVVSDIHLGHKNTKASDIVRNLSDMFDNFLPSSEHISLDLIFIAGDLFDRLLDFHNDDIHDATIWLTRLIGFCDRHSIKLRVLEGTPSHDRGQSKIVDTILDLLEVKADVKYIDTLHIEHMEDIDLTVLYVPDEWTASTDTTFEQVKTLLKENHLTEVDIAIMHGCFNYQVKGIPVKLDSFNESDYLGIVKYFINVGHFHTFSTYERIVAQGSFDRLCHGEEEPKGLVKMHIGEKSTFQFLENKAAKLYKTITIRFKELEKALKTLERQLADIPTGSYIRIRAGKDHPIYTALDDIKRMYPLLTFSKITEEALEVKNASLIDNIFDSSYMPISITENNILGLLTDRLKDKKLYSETELENIEGILKEVHIELS